MNADASTLSTGPEAAPGSGRLRERWQATRRLLSLPSARGNAALALIVALSALIVIAAAGRPSFLSSTTRPDYFPGWMAGPFGGLWTGIAGDPALKWMFSGAVLLAYFGYVTLIRHASHVRTRTLVIAIAAVQLIYLLSPPLALTDVFNYLNYARMEVVHHLNPYVTMPILEPHGDPAYSLSNWHGLLSPYGPLFTIFTFAFTPLSLAAYLWTYKAVLLLADGLIIALTWLCARLLGREARTAVVFVALNPIVLIWGLGADHNDFFTILFVIGALYMLLLSGAGSKLSAAGGDSRADRINARILGLAGGRTLDGLAGGALVVATGMKASAGVALPIVLAALVHRRERAVAVLAGALLAGVIAAVATLFAFGLHFPDLAIQGSLVTALSVPNLLGLMLGLGGESATLHTFVNLALAGSVTACCVWAWRRRSALEAIGFSTIAIIVTLSWTLPWYILWVLPIAAISSSGRLRQASLLLGVYLIVTWVPVTSQIMSSLGLHPQRTTVGREHARAVQELLNP